MAIMDNSAAMNYINDIFGYMDETTSVIPSQYKSVIDDVLGLLSDNNGPTIDLVYDTEADGYRLSYEGTIYSKDQYNDFLTAVDVSGFGEKYEYGSLGTNPEEGSDYTAAHLAEILGTKTVNLPTIYGSDNVKIPGSNAIIRIREGTNADLPTVQIELGSGNTIDVIAPYDALIAAGYSAETLQSLLYLNYQIKKSKDGDAIFKCFLSETPINASENPEDDFEDLSINHYNTSIQYVSNNEPKVCHDCTLVGGFAILQYETAVASDISMEGLFRFGYAFMNTSRAPLIYITAETSSIVRAVTTSLSNITDSVDGPSGESVTQLSNEVFLRPISSDSFSEDSIMLAPIVAPSSGQYYSVRSRWICMGNNAVINSVRTIGASFNTFHNDHGLCLGGGV